MKPFIIVMLSLALLQNISKLGDIKPTDKGFVGAFLGIVIAIAGLILAIIFSCKL